MISLNLSGNSVIAFAAEGSNKSELPKGLCIVIMVFVFIISAAVTGFITFKKIKSKKSDISAEKLPSDKDK